MPKTSSIAHRNAGRAACTPICSHCGCRIIVHGVEANDGFYLLRSLRNGRRGCRKLSITREAIAQGHGGQGT